MRAHAGRGVPADQQRGGTRGRADDRGRAGLLLGRGRLGRVVVAVRRAAAGVVLVVVHGLLGRVGRGRSAIVRLTASLDIKVDDIE